MSYLKMSVSNKINRLMLWKIKGSITFSDCWNVVGCHRIALLEVQVSIGHGYCIHEWQALKCGMEEIQVSRWWQTGWLYDVCCAILYNDSLTCIIVFFSCIFIISVSSSLHIPCSLMKFNILLTKVMTFFPLIVI